MTIKERPILFSAPMVRATLAGQKTMTRRVIKEHPLEGPADAIFPDGSGKGFVAWWGPGPHTAEKTAKLYPGEDGFKCPYGQVGDRLWVRESWKTYASLDHLPPREISTWAAIEYSAGGSNVVGQESLHGMGKSRPSIFMPRWASRITLEITGVKVERLQDITDIDAMAEGLSRLSKDALTFKYGIPDRDGLPGNDDCGWHWKEWTANPGVAFKKLWDSINGKTPGKSWDDNPYVWAVSFKRVDA